MQPTLCLPLPSPPPCPLATIPSTSLHRAMPIAHALVPLIKECIARDIVLFDVRIDIIKRPRKQRVELEKPSRVNFKGLEVCTICTLGCASASYYGADFEFFVCAFGRFDLNIILDQNEIGDSKERTLTAQSYISSFSSHSFSLPYSASNAFTSPHPAGLYTWTLRP